MPATPRVTGVLETSLYVADLDRACEFYERVFGFERFVHDGRMCALGVPGSQVLLLFKHGSTNEPAPTPGGIIPPHHGSGNLHLCFAIPFGELSAWETHLQTLGIDVESRVRWARGGTSLYFRDPDSNSLEVATPGLAEPLNDPSVAGYARRPDRSRVVAAAQRDAICLLMAPLGAPVTALTHINRADLIAGTLWLMSR